MAEKRVSVRLAAVGGKQVKAELVGIGDAGKKGFGKASREMEIANARLAKFARRAKIAVGIMTAAAAAAGIAMVRSGLKTIDEQAKLAASLRTTTASMQVLARAAELAGVSQGEVEQATIMMTKSLSQAAQETGPAVKALKALNLSAAVLSKLPIDEKMAKIQDAIAKFIPTAQQAAVASQIFGARAGLIFTRIDTATLRQAKKDVVDFGVATSEIDAAQVQLTNDALSRTGLLWRGISNQLAVATAPALEKVANVMASIVKTTGPLGRAIKMLFDNLKQVAIVFGSFATFMAGRFVVSMTAAALGISRVTLSLKALRIAMTRTAIGALILGLGELVANGPAVAKAINNWLNPQSKFQVATANVVAAMGDEILQSQQLDAVLQRGSVMSENMAKTKLSEAEARYKNVTAILAEQRAAALSSKDYSRLLANINDQRDALNATGFPSLDVAVGSKKSAFEADQRALANLLMQQQKMLEAPKKMQKELLLTQKNIASIEVALSLASNGMVSFGDVLIKPVTATKLIVSELAKAGKASKNAADIAKSAWEAASISLNDYSISSMDISKGVSDTLTRGFKNMEGAFKEFVKTGKTDFKSLVSSMLADLALLEFKKAVLGPLAGSLSGAFSLFSGPAPGTSASIFHSGGLVGAGGPSRMVPSMAFAGAPRMHNGGWAGIKPGEIPAILQRGERVLSRREVAAGGSGSAAPTQIELHLSGDLDARIARQSEGVAVAIFKSGIDTFSNEALPHRVHQIAKDGKAIG